VFKKNIFFNTLILKIINIFLFIFLFIYIFSPLQFIYALGIDSQSDILTSQKASTVSNHTIVFRTPIGAGQSTDTIVVTLPSGFTTNSFDFADVDLAHSAGGQTDCVAPTFTNDEALAATPSATDWGAALSGQVLTLTAPTDGVGVTAITTNACIRIKIGTNATTGGTGNTQITNNATPGSYIIGISGTFGGLGDITINILSDDQVSIIGTVNEVISFSISDPNIGFGVLSSSSARYATGDNNGSVSDTADAHTFSASTNASSGYSIIINGATLTSGINTVTAIGGTAVASSVGTEQFGIRLIVNSGTGSATSPYASSNWAFDTVNFPDQVASGSGDGTSTVFGVRYISNVSVLTEAGDYNTALSYIITANY